LKKLTIATKLQKKHCGGENNKMIETDTHSNKVQSKHTRSERKGQIPFPFKLHALIDDAKKDGRDDIVSWIQEGTAFQIHKPKEFTDLLLPEYFHHQIKYRSIQRQLHLYGFQLLKKSGRSKATPLRGAYFHPLFIQGERDLCLQMTRHKLNNRSKNVKRDSMQNSRPKLAEIGKNNKEFLKMEQRETFVEEKKVLKLKRNLDQILECLEGSITSNQQQEEFKSPSLLKIDDLREGDATFFEGRKFYIVEY